jgi:hypothetical protein
MFSIILIHFLFELSVKIHKILSFCFSLAHTFSLKFENFCEEKMGIRIIREEKIVCRKK